ncbi:MAG: T9SS type B sorting domain-containing protein, partial [Bacteroidales bacterium]|nr:T9SS type B sorting domain-containing protein [Bacteroidales bacterium]
MNRIISGLTCAGMMVFISGFSQIDFIIPDTMCIGDSMQVQYTGSYDAQSYYWNFCSGSLDYTPNGENISDIGLVNGPAFIDLVKYNNQFYSFITNHKDGTLTRNSFGDNLLNNPVSENLGQVGGISRLEGIQVIEDNGHWYGFVVGGIGNESSLIRIDFPGGPASGQVVDNLGNPGEMSYPIDLFLYPENGTWIGFTVNYTTSTITRFVFENGLNSPPLGENLGNIGNLNNPCGVHPIFEEGVWYLFVTNFGSGTITRLDFGTSLLNTPSGTNIGGSGSIAYPFDMTIIRDCEHIFGFVINHYHSELVRMDFGTDIHSVPAYENLGNVGQMYQPHGLSEIFRENDALYFLASNVNNTITRIFFEPCTNASMASYSGKNPPRVTYNQAGIYNVSLIVDEGLPTSQTLCKNVVAFPNPDVFLGNDTSLLPGESIDLTPGEGYTLYEWSTRENSSEITVHEKGEYRVVVTDTNQCKASDAILIDIAFYIPNFFTPNGDGTNDEWTIPYFEVNPVAKIYIYDRYGKELDSFEAEEGWDGTTYSGNPLKADTYWYVIRYDDKSKKPETGY